MQRELLLLEDVVGLGRKGELVANVKAGFIRNFLLPQKKAVIADKRALRLQEKLKAERAAQSALDRKDSEAIKAKIDEKVFEVTVKVDSDGNLYGSVSAQDIQDLLKSAGVHVERYMIRVGGSIKKLGTHHVPLKLKEDVHCAITIKVFPDHPVGGSPIEGEKPSKG